MHYISNTWNGLKEEQIWQTATSCSLFFVGTINTVCGLASLAFDGARFFSFWGGECALFTGFLMLYGIGKSFAAIEDQTAIERFNGIFIAVSMYLIDIAINAQQSLSIVSIFKTLLPVIFSVLLSAKESVSKTESLEVY